jgi:hypothetical protein
MGRVGPGTSSRILPVRTPRPVCTGHRRRCNSSGGRARSRTNRRPCSPRFRASTGRARRRISPPRCRRADCESFSVHRSNARNSRASSSVARGPRGPGRTRSRARKPCTSRPVLFRPAHRELLRANPCQPPPLRSGPVGGPRHRRRLRLRSRPDFRCPREHRSNRQRRPLPNLDGLTPPPPPRTPTLTRGSGSKQLSTKLSHGGTSVCFAPVAGGAERFAGCEAVLGGVGHPSERTPGPMK